MEHLLVNKWIKPKSEDYVAFPSKNKTITFVGEFTTIFFFKFSATSANKGPSVLPYKTVAMPPYFRQPKKKSTLLLKSNGKT